MSAKSSRHATGSDSLVQQIDLSTLKFKPRIPKTSDPKSLDEVHCYVCFQFHKLHGSGIERKLPYPDRGLDILTCYGCGLTVHHYCYGLKTPYNELREHSKEAIKMFVCEKCHETGPSVLRECLVCLQKGGALKKVSNDGYVHITCALFSEMYCIDDFERMSIRPCSKLEKRPSKQNKPCEHCHKATNLMKCGNTACELSTHIYCALKSAAQALPESEENKSGWSFRLGNEENPTKIVVDNEDPKVQRLLEEVQGRLQEVNSKGEHEKMKEESKNDSGTKGKKKTKKGKNQENSEEAMAAEEEEKAMKELCGDIREKISDVIKELPMGNNARGGSVVLQCEDHKALEPYCICGKPYEAGREMVACDCCDNWFDYGCLGFTREQEDRVKLLKAYFCKKCRKWKTYVRDFFVKGPEAVESVEQNDIGNPYCEMIDGLQCMPKDTFKFTVVEYIIICIILQIKLTRKLDAEVIQKGDSLQDLLVRFLDSAKHIPFNINGIAINMIQKYYLDYGIGVLLEKAVPLAQYESIDSIYDAETNTFDNEKAEKLQEQIQQLSSLQKIYKDYNLEKSPTAIRIQRLLDKQNWLLDVCKAFSQEGQKENISSEKLTDLLNRAGTLGFDGQNPERVYLEGLAGSLSNWGSEIKKAINEKTGAIKSKIVELEGVEAQNLPLEKALKALDDIEVICKAALEVKPSVNELEEILGKCQGEGEGGMESEENVKGIKGELNKVKDQDKRRVKKGKGHDDLERKTLEVCESVVVPAEGESLVEEYKKGKTMQLKLQYYNKQGVREVKQENNGEEKMEVEEEEEENGDEKRSRKAKGSGKKSKENKRKNSRGNMEKGEHENQEEEVLMEKSEDGGEIGTVEELEQLVKESEGMDNKFMKDKKAVKEMLGEVMKLKKKIKEGLGGNVTDVKELEAIVKESRKYRIAFKEKEEIREKCRIYREKVMEVRNRYCSIDELASVKEEFGKVFKDVRMQSEIKGRMDKARKLEKEAEKMLNKKTFSREDVEKKAQGMVVEMQEQKVKLNHKEDLENLQRSLEWLERLYRFRKQCMSSDKKGANGHMEVEKEDKEKKDEGDEEMEQEDEEKKEEDDEKDEEGLSVDSLVKACEIKGPEWEEMYRKRYEEFKEILNEGQKERHRDQRIEKVYKEHAKLYCEIEAGFLVGRNKMLDIDDVDRVCEIAQRLGIENGGEMYEKVLAAQENYRRWIQEVEEVVSAEELGYAFDEECRGKEEDLVRLREKARRLVEEYEEIGVEAEEENKVLKSVWRWLEWSGKGREMLKMVKEAQKASLEAIEDFVSYAKDIKLSTDNWLYREINKALDELDALKEEFDESKKTRKVIKKKIRGIYKEFDVNKRKKNLERLCREKPKIEKAKEIEKKVKDSSLYVIQSEVDEMQGEIKKCVAWAEKVAGFMEKYGKELMKPKEEGWDQFVVKEEEIGKIQKEISGIKGEMRNLVLRDAGAEEEMKRFEWFFRSRLLLDRKLQRGNGIRAWVKLRKIAENDRKGEKKLGETGMFEEIKKEIGKYEEIIKKIEGLKIKENLLMQNWWMTQGNNIEAINREGVRKEELEDLLKEMELECKIDLSMESGHLRELLASGEETLNIYKGVTSGEFGEKPNVDVVTNLLKRFYSTIVEYPEEEKVLKEYIKKAEEMWAMLQRFAGGLEKIGTLYERYQECPVYIDGAEKLCEEYVRENELGEKVEMMMSDENCRLKDVEKALDEIKGPAVMDFEGKMSEARRKLHRMRIRCLKKVSEKDEVKEEERVRFETIKKWKDEANQILSEEKDRDEAQEELEWMEQLVREVKSRVDEICGVKEVSEITDEMNIACKFVDVRKDVVEHKRRLEKVEKKRLEAEALAAKAALEEENRKSVAVVDVVDVVEIGDDKVMETERIEVTEVVQVVGEEKKAEAGDDELLGKRNLEGMEQEPHEDIESQKVEVLSNKEDEDLGPTIHKKVKSDLEAEKKREIRSHGIKREENERREQARRKIMQALNQNRHFGEMRNRFKGIVKKLELKMFLQEGTRVRQYEKLVEEACWLLGFLDCNQSISKNLVERDFGLEYIEELIEKFSATKARRSKKENVRKEVERPVEQKKVVVMTETVIEEDDVVVEESAMVQTQEIKPMKTEEKDEGTISVSSHASFVETVPKKKEDKKTKIQDLEEEDEEDVEEEDDEEGEDIEDEDEEDEEDLDEEEEEDEEDYEDEEDDEQEVVNLESEEDEAHKKQSHVSSHPLTQIVPEIEKQAEESLPVYEKGSILMIYEGKINSTELLNRSVSLTASSGVRMCSLYTCEDCTFVRKFPKLPKELSIIGKSTQKDGLDYVEDLHKDWTSTPGKEKPYIVGWIEAKRDVQADIARLGEDLLERKKVALIRYSDFAEMYLFHPAMLKKELVKKLDWKVQTVAGQRKPKTTLLFMINRKHRAIIKPFEKIEPQFVGVPEKPAEEKTEDEVKGGMEVLEVEEASDLVSPLTSLADEEQMLNGQAFNQMQFANMGNMMMAMGGQGMLEQFMAASMLGGPMGGPIGGPMGGMTGMTGMGYNPEFMSMMGGAQGMTGFGQGQRVSVGNKGSKAWDGKKRGHENVIVDDEEEEEVEDEEDLEDEDDEEDEEDEEDVEDEDEDGEDMEEGEYENYVKMQEILQKRLEKPQPKKGDKKEEPQEIESDDDEEGVKEEEGEDLEDEDEEDEEDEDEDEDEVEEIEDDEEEQEKEVRGNVRSQGKKQPEMMEIGDDDDEPVEFMEVDKKKENVVRPGEVMETEEIREVSDVPGQELVEKNEMMEVEAEGPNEEQQEVHTQEIQTQESRKEREQGQSQEQEGEEVRKNEGEGQGQEEDQ